MKNLLSFAVEDIGGVFAVTPCIDDTPLTVLVEAFESLKGYDDPAGGYAGIVPAHFKLGPLGSYFLGHEEPVEGDQPGQIYALFCTCGEAGCWPLTAHVALSPDTVRWDGFGQPHRPERDYSGFGPFLFDRVQYDVAVSEIASLDGLIEKP